MKKLVLLLVFLVGCGISEPTKYPHKITLEKDKPVYFENILFVYEGTSNEYCGGLIRYHSNNFHQISIVDNLKVKLEGTAYFLTVASYNEKIFTGIIDTLEL